MFGGEKFGGEKFGEEKMLRMRRKMSDATFPLCSSFSPLAFCVFRRESLFLFLEERDEREKDENLKKLPI